MKLDKSNKTWITEFYSNANQKNLLFKITVKPLRRAGGFPVFMLYLWDNRTTKRRKCLFVHQMNRVWRFLNKNVLLLLWMLKVRTDQSERSVWPPQFIYRNTLNTMQKKSPNTLSPSHSYTRACSIVQLLQYRTISIIERADRMWRSANMVGDGGGGASDWTFTSTQWRAENTQIQRLVYHFHL